MAVDFSKVSLTKSQRLLLTIMVNADANRKPGPRLTLEEIAAKYSARTKKPAKTGTVTTMASQLRKAFKDGGQEFPTAWDIKKGEGGGRTRERVSAADALNEIFGGQDYDLEAVVDGEDENNAEAEG